MYGTAFLEQGSLMIMNSEQAAAPALVCWKKENDDMDTYIRAFVHLDGFFHAEVLQVLCWT